MKIKNLRFFTILAMIIVGISLLFGCGKPAARATKEEATRDAGEVFDEFKKVLKDVPKPGACGLFDLSFLNDEGASLQKSGASGTFEIKKTEKTKSNNKDSKKEFDVEYIFTDFSLKSDSPYIFSTYSQEAVASGGTKGSQSIKIRKATVNTDGKTSSGVVNGNLFMIENKEGGKRYQIKFNAINIENTEQTCGEITSIKEQEVKGKTTEGKTTEGKTTEGATIKLAYQEKDQGPYIPIAIIYSSEIKEEVFLKALLKG